MADVNRATRRALLAADLKPKTALVVTRMGDHVYVGIEQGGAVRLTDVEAVQFAESVLTEAGCSETETPAR